MKVVRVSGTAGHAPGLELEPVRPDVPRVVPRRHRGIPGRKWGGRCRHVTDYTLTLRVISLEGLWDTLECFEFN